MSVVPQGRSIQTLYRDYRENKLFVNRKYQRKLVWSLEEKEKLIDSILEAYPVPLILLAERRDIAGNQIYEIIDGMQRLNAIFSFIENSYSFKGKYFDVNEFVTAKQKAQEGMFVANTKGPFLTRNECAKILDYQLAITIYPVVDDKKITNVFGRINSNGRRLSPQEQRQAGIASNFSSFIRKVSSEIRGDVSREVLLLSQMPEISIERKKEDYGYGIKADDTIWCKQGIISIDQLKDSEDEQFIVDFVASILDQPIPASKELLDRLYDTSSKEGKDIEPKLVTYGMDKLSNEIKGTISIIKELIESQDPSANALRNLVRPKSGHPIKVPFYTIFMAFFDLVVRQKKTPENYKKIWEALHGLDAKLEKGTHYQTTNARNKNIKITKGLIQDYFIDKEPPVLGHGPALTIDLENSLRRSKVETSRYEFKQGILTLESARGEDKNILSKISNTICGISNLGPDSEGYIYIGIADDKKDAERIGKLDRIRPLKIADKFVVGIDREAKVLKIPIEKYVQRIIQQFQNTNISEPLKSQVLAKFDVVEMQKFSIIRIHVPKQNKVSFVGNEAFYREGSNTVRAEGKKLLAINDLFKN